MDIFELQVPRRRLHPVFNWLLAPEHAAERRVLANWASGFIDRDGKFVKELQTTFESCLWELYLHAALGALGIRTEQGAHAPDFVAIAPESFTMEAAICAPARGEAPGFGPGAPDVPDDLNEFNRLAILRICNTFSAKLERYRAHYSGLGHVRGRPFVLAMAPFDRANAHLAIDRPIRAALYGHYLDDEATIASHGDTLVEYTMTSVVKNAGVEIPLGFFDSDAHKEISAVVFSPCAGWGKLKALAHPSANASTFVTLHPSTRSLAPEVRRTPGDKYQEHILDGLYVFHNPHAEHPLPADVFDHPSICQFVADRYGDVEKRMPPGFLLFRSVRTRVKRGTFVFAK